MKNEKEFYELIMKKHEQHVEKRIRRRQAGILVSVVSLGAVLLAVGGLCLLPEAPRIQVSPSTSSSNIGSTSSGTTQTTNPIGIGGADYLYYDRPFKDKFYPDGAFQSEDAVPNEELYAWIRQFEHANEGGTRSKHEYTVYNMIRELNIPRETVERLCAEQIILYRDEWGYPQEVLDESCLTPQEIEMLYTQTEKELFPCFVTNVTIAVEDRFFTPKWLAEHTAEEYISAGITVEQVETAYRAIDADTAPPESAKHIFEQIQQMKALQ